jgi:hypothetical protein
VGQHAQKLAFAPVRRRDLPLVISAGLRQQGRSRPVPRWSRDCRGSGSAVPTGNRTPVMVPFPIKELFALAFTQVVLPPSQRSLLCCLRATETKWLGIWEWGSGCVAAVTALPVNAKIRARAEE